MVRKYNIHYEIHFKLEKAPSNCNCILLVLLLLLPLSLPLHISFPSYFIFSSFCSHQTLFNTLLFPIYYTEMGLGKTLQTAAFIQLLVEKMHQPGPFLICVPLSTLAHWQREFIGWTGLNTIVYHGSADDRKRIREVEFAYEKDRPDKPGWGVNSLYLKKCEAAKRGSGGYTQWMTTVVVTTPEMLVADDWNELTFVKWSVLVVDEVRHVIYNTT